MQNNKVLGIKQAYRSTWLGIKHIDVQINGKRITNYQMVFRPTTEKGGYEIDGVDVIPIIKYKEKPSQILLIANYRPPANKFVLEFPAGLMDKGSLEENAKRQLREQTGYVVDRFFEYPTVVYWNDPWKSNERSKAMIAIIDGDKNEKFQQQLDHEENIIVHLLPLDQSLLTRIEQLQKQHSYEIEAKLWTLALGVQLLTLIK